MRKVKFSKTLSEADNAAKLQRRWFPALYGGLAASLRQAFEAPKASRMTGQAAIRIGSRGSKLALAQAAEVKARLRAVHSDLAAEDAVEIVVIRTTGDRIQDRRLMEVGGKGLFTKEIEEALLDGVVDAAVHSMKDVPTWLPDRLEIAAILPREDARDAIFSPHGASLAGLPAGAVVGTASLRRQSQVLLARPDLKVVNFRGNVDTRLRKLAAGEVDATLLAVAGLKRLGQEELITAPLSPEEVLPAVGQGAIGIELCSGDARMHRYFAALDDAPSAARVRAERACLEVLDGSCRTPIAAYAELFGGDRLLLRGLVAMPDGSTAHRTVQEGSVVEAEALGRAVGQELREAAGPDFFAALADG